MNFRRRSALTFFTFLSACLIDSTGSFGDTAWPSGPMEVVVSLTRPVTREAADRLVGRTIPYHSMKADGSFDPAAEPIGRLNIAGATPTADGRILVLATDPHPTQAVYVLPLEGVGEEPSLTYLLNGVSASWFEGEDPEFDPTWTAWLSRPAADEFHRWAEIVGSSDYEGWSKDVRKVGRLRFDALVKLPAGNGVVTVESPQPIVEFFVGDGVMEDESERTAQGGWRGSAPIGGADFSQPAFLSLTVETGADDGGSNAKQEFSYRFEPADGSEPTPLMGSMVLPWVSTSLAEGSPRPMAIPDLSGGDPVKGKDAFFSKEALCAQCHVVQGEGGAVGPDLTTIGRKGIEHLYRSIAVPSESLTPDFLTYTVTMKDGRVAAGIVRAEGADAVRVLDADSNPTVLPRAEIEDVRPSATSLMPVGLLPVLGEERLRDLVAYLMTTAGSQ